MGVADFGARSFGALFVVQSLDQKAASTVKMESGVMIMSFLIPELE